MPVKTYWLHSFENTSRLGVMARPRGNEWLEEEILSLKRQGVRMIVSLLDRKEIYELGLEKEAELCFNRGLAHKGEKSGRIYQRGRRRGTAHQSSPVPAGRDVARTRVEFPERRELVTLRSAGRQTDHRAKPRLVDTGGRDSNGDIKKL